MNPDKLDFICCHGLICDVCKNKIIPNKDMLLEFNDHEFTCGCNFPTNISSHRYDYLIPVMRCIIMNDLVYCFLNILHQEDGWVNIYEFDNSKFLTNNVLLHQIDSLEFNIIKPSMYEYAVMVEKLLKLNILK